MIDILERLEGVSKGIAYIAPGFSIIINEAIEEIHRLRTEVERLQALTTPPPDHKSSKESRSG